MGNKIKISYQDKHYELYISTAEMIGGYFNQIIISEIYKALEFFHHESLNLHNENYKLKSLLHFLIAEHPSIATNPEVKKYLGI